MDKLEKLAKEIITEARSRGLVPQNIKDSYISGKYSLMIEQNIYKNVPKNEISVYSFDTGEYKEAVFRTEKMWLKMKQRYELCSECGRKIYYETDEYEQDDCYEIEKNEYICEDCIIDYVKGKYFKKLEEE